MKYKSKTEYFSKSTRQWLERSQDTAQLVVICYEYMFKKHRLTSENIHQLIRLVWITKGRNKTTGDVNYDSCLKSIKLPALQKIFHTAEDNLEDISKFIRKNIGRQVNGLHHIITAPTGIVNLRNTYRGAVLDWVNKHRSSILRILKDTHSNRTPAGAEQIAVAVHRLPGVETNAGQLHAMTLLSPLLACLEPNHKFPIINSNDSVKAMLQQMRMPAKSAAERFGEFINIFNSIPCNGLELDQIGADYINILTYKPVASEKGTTRTVDKMARTSSLELKDQSDINEVATSNNSTMRRVHNRMTNALLTRARGRYTILEGRTRPAKFDAIIKAYDVHRKRDLLIEVKSSSEIGVVRLAVGQLYDYHRHLPQRYKVDLAVLFPERPSHHSFDLLESLGIKVLWFNDSKFSSIMSNDKAINTIANET